MMMTIIFFIIGLSVLLAYNWTGEPGPPFNSTTILFGILVAAIIYFAARVQKGGFGLRMCPACGRQIPFDARLSSYCGRQLP